MGTLGADEIQPTLSGAPLPEVQQFEARQFEARQFEAQVAALIDATGTIGVAVIDGRSLQANASFSSLLGSSTLGDVDSLLKALPEPMAVRLTRMLASDTGRSPQRLGRLRHEAGSASPASLVEMWLIRLPAAMGIVARDISDQLAAIEAHRGLVGAALRVRADDRRSLAVALHDGPVQLLASISLEMGLLRRLVNQEQRTRLLSMERRIGESLVQLRSILASVAPDSLSAPELLPEVSRLFQAAGVREPETLTVDLPPDTDGLALGVLLESIQLICSTVPRAPRSLRVESADDAALLRVRYEMDELEEVEGRNVLNVLTPRLELAGGVIGVSHGTIEVVLGAAAFDEGCPASVLP